MFLLLHSYRKSLQILLACLTRLLIEANEPTIVVSLKPNEEAHPHSWSSTRQVVVEHCLQSPCSDASRRQKLQLDGAVEILSMIWQHITKVIIVSVFIIVLTGKLPGVSELILIGHKH